MNNKIFKKMENTKLATTASFNTGHQKQKIVRYGISFGTKRVSLAIAAISAALLLMGIGATSTSAKAFWYNPEESGQTWGPGGSEYRWHTPGGIYGGHGWGPHPHWRNYGPYWRGGDGGEFHPLVTLGPGQSLHYSGPSQYTPHVVCHYHPRGFGGFGYTEQNDQC